MKGGIGGQFGHTQTSVFSRKDYCWPLGGHLILWIDRNIYTPENWLDIGLFYIILHLQEEIYIFKWWIFLLSCFEGVYLGPRKPICLDQTLLIFWGIGNFVNQFLKKSEHNGSLEDHGSACLGGYYHLMRTIFAKCKNYVSHVISPSIHPSIL